MKKQWKLDNKGMTLLEVIVAFAIFAIAATILITGFNGALKVMGNSAAIKDASQQSASDIELENADKKLGTISFVSNVQNYTLKGTFYIAETLKKNNDGGAVLQRSFVINKLDVPEIPSPPVSVDPPSPSEPSYEYQNWDMKNTYYDGKTPNDQPVSYVKYNGRFYRCIKTHTVNDPSWNPTVSTLWVRVNDPGKEWIEWEQLNISYGNGAKVIHNGGYWIRFVGDMNATTDEPGPNSAGWARVNGVGEEEKIIDFVWTTNYYSGTVVRFGGNIYQNKGDTTAEKPPNEPWFKIN